MFIYEVLKIICKIWIETKTVSNVEVDNVLFVPVLSSIYMIALILIYMIVFKHIFDIIYYEVKCIDRGFLWAQSFAVKHNTNPKGEGRC